MKQRRRCGARECFPRALVFASLLAASYFDFNKDILMTLLTRSRPSSRRLVPGGLAVLGVALGLSIAASPTSAQTIAERILSPDVSDIGAEKGDVQAAAVRISNNDAAGALDFLKSAKKKNPAIAPAHVLMARMLMMNGKRSLARASLERAVKETPGDPEPYLLFGQLANSSGRFTDAELLFEKTATMATTFIGSAKRKRRFLIGAFSGQASIAERREQWAVAERLLRELIVVDPDTGTSHQRLGIALFHQDKAKEAYEALKGARAADASLPAAEIVLSTLYSQNDDDASAQKWIDYALEKNPDDTSTRLAVVTRLLINGKAEQAKVQADAAYQADKTSIDAKVLRGIAARMTGNYENAELWLLSAHRQAPTRFDAMNHLVHALLAQDDKAKRDLAFQYATLSNRVYPYQANRPTVTGIESTVTLGWAFYQTNRTKEAAQLLNSVLSQINRSPAGSYYVSKILVDRGQTKDAAKLLEGALKTKRLFVERAAAEKLLAQIKGSAGK
jgi:tetratricopeptide (TPR) repeat protein